MKILSYTLIINTLLSAHISTKCMQLESLPKTYTTIRDLLASEQYRSGQFSDKVITLEEKKLLADKDNSFTFKARMPYFIINHTVNSASVKKTICTEFNDQYNKIILKTSHISFNLEQKYTIESINVTALPTQQIKPDPASVLPQETLPLENTQQLNIVPILNSNAQNPDHEDETITTQDLHDTTTSNDCFWPLIVVGCIVLSKPFKISTRLIARLLPRIPLVFIQKNLK